MRKVLCSLIVLAILVGMFVCLGAQAFADGEGPKDLAVVAVADAALSSEHIDRIKQDKQDCDVLVIDINGLDFEQPGDGYSFVYSEMDPFASPSGYEYIWPGKGEITRVVTNDEGQECTVVLIPVGAEDTVETINAIVANYKLEGQMSVIIAIAPAAANVQAAVDSDVDKVLTCGDTGVYADKLIKVGEDSSAPVSVLVVDEMAGIQAQSMPLPEAADPGVGAMEPQAGDPGTDTVTETPQQFTITFNPNGGAEEAFTLTVGQEQGYSITLPQNSFTHPEGRQFVAWQNVDDFIDYQPGDTVSEISSDMTFQATWSEPVVEQAPAAFSVTFVPGDGATGTPYVVSDVTADTQLGMIEMPSDFAKDGFTFTGWLLDGVHYDVYEPYYVSGETTITAEWTQAATADVPETVIYTVTYELNGGTNVDEAANPLQEQKDFTDILAENRYFGVPDGSWITPPEGKKFNGWLCSLDQKVYMPMVDDPDAAQVLLTGDVTFTAQWVEDEESNNTTDQERTLYTVILKANSDSATEGVDVDSSVQEYAGNVIILPECSFTAPENYVFAGWVMENTDSVYKPGDEYTMTEANVTFIAKWALTSATVTYVADNGTEATHAEPVALTDGTAQHTLIAQPAEFTAPEGKTFGGWLVSEGNTQQPGTAVTVTADMQIKAVWNDAAKAQNQDPGATTTGDVNFTQTGTDAVTLSYNAVIANVFVDNAQLVLDQDYTLAADGKSFTFINGYLNKLTVGSHILNVTFQDSDTATYKSNTRNLVIAAAPVATAEPVQQNNYKIEWSDRSSSVSQTFVSAPVKVEIYYGEQTNSDGSKTPVYREAVRDRDYTVSGNTLTLLPALINGNWGVWPNATYSLRVTLADDGIALAAANGTVNNPVTLQISLSGATPIVNPTPSPSPVPGNPNVPVTGDETPITLYIVILVVLIIALAGVLIFVMKRRSSGSRGRH